MAKDKKTKKEKTINKTIKKESSIKNDLKKTELELNKLKDKHLRLKAEFENFRRRKSEEISRLLQYEGESIIKGFLPILDDIRRMISTKESSKKLLKEGIVLVNSKVQKYFESLEITQYGDKGEVMDPDIHEAMLTQKDESSDNDVIIDVFEKGYKYRDKVIRHAKVVVNKK